MYYISGSIVGFAIKIESIQKINKKEAEGYIQLFLEQVKQEDGIDPNIPNNELSEDLLECYKMHESNLRKIFGLPHDPIEPNGSLVLPFRFIRDLFGTELEIDINIVEMPPIHDLEFKNSKLNGPYKTPFGFPPEDENIAYLTLEEIKEERQQLEGCLQKTYEEVRDFRGMNPQQIEEEKEVWTNLIFPARETYLDWLDYCLLKEMDLIIIEYLN
ncbi:hypothetical protein F1728_10085 [Gimesia benthica]|uniref:DUF1877 family protein n=1 Tax=Gimesia benthica TaxID=2608982 RepID=A0A6I6A9G5_9PLAN|nr:hypothetical protein [Gimesia benthica]QGQ22997.1 hypothetical protein F1728_10085 [Gimesia benthica]